jgi:hypothetical protein
MKVLILSRSISAPTAMSWSIKRGDSRRCRNCTLQVTPQLSTSTVQVKLVGMGEDG